MAGMIFGGPDLLYWRYSRNMPIGLVSCLPGWESLLPMFPGGPLSCELSGIATGASLPREG